MFSFASPCSASAEVNVWLSKSKAIGLGARIFDELQQSTDGKVLVAMPQQSGSGLTTGYPGGSGITFWSRTHSRNESALILGGRFLRRFSAILPALGID